jgi:membrane-bound lytic murein transglycosylase B
VTRSGRAARALTLLAAAGLVAGCAAARPQAARPVRASAASAGSAARPGRSPSSPKPSSAPPSSALPPVGADPARLAAQLTAAEAALSRAGAHAAALTRQALTVQLTCLKLAAHPGWAGRVIRRVPRAWRAAAAADITATADLVALTSPRPRPPPWRIIPAPSQAALRADYRAAQAATGVGWSYLAAINFVETDFGRIAGPSSAGAQGPMQFLPATWAIYGRGDIHSPRAAISAAARFLRAHGAARAIGPALYAYNPSWRYVAAVLRYARRLRASPGALASYYRRQVICQLASGWVWLPPGYGTSPAVHAIPVHL